MPAIRRTAAMLVLAAPLLIAAVPSQAADLRTPDPALSPRDVVAIQLDALRANDTPATDAGIAQTWVFAHPDNKRVTGPLARFAQMIKGPAYRILLNHRSHRIEEVARAADQVEFEVTVTVTSGRAFGYRWSVGKLADGADNAGAWMTVGVSPPVELGDAI